MVEQLQLPSNNNHTYPVIIATLPSRVNDLIVGVILPITLLSKATAFRPASTVDTALGKAFDLSTEMVERSGALLEVLLSFT